MADKKKSTLFRKEATHSLASPEDLEQLVTVVTPLGWLVMLVLWLILIATLIWGFIGSIPTTVSGGGILLRDGRIASIMSPASGQLKELHIAVGDMVTTQQQVGVIWQPVMETRIIGQKDQVQQLKENFVQVTANQNTILASTLDYYDKQSKSYKDSARDYEERAKSLLAIVQAQQKLLKEGLVTELSLISSQNDRSKAE